MGNSPVRPNNFIYKLSDRGPQNQKSGKKITPNPSPRNSSSISSPRIQSQGGSGSTIRSMEETSRLFFQEGREKCSLKLQNTPHAVPFFVDFLFKIRLAEEINLDQVVLVCYSEQKTAHSLMLFCFPLLRSFWSGACGSRSVKILSLFLGRRLNISKAKLVIPPGKKVPNFSAKFSVFDSSSRFQVAWRIGVLTAKPPTRVRCAFNASKRETTKAMTTLSIGVNLEVPKKKKKKDLSLILFFRML